MTSANLTALADLLRSEYGIVPMSMVAGPRGFVGETYIVAAADGRLFAKLLPPEPHIAAMTRNLAVLEELYALGIENLNVPFRTKKGALTALFGARTLVLSPFIAGRASGEFDYSFEDYVELLACIHAATAQVKSPISSEDFSLHFATEFRRYYEYVLGMEPATAAQAKTQRLISAQQGQMDRDWTELLALAEACRSAKWDGVITHSDAQGDNIISGADGRLYLIDWDELMLAPPERDTWFHLNSDEESARFLSIYRRTFPDYTPGPTLHRFYLFRRFFEDTIGYLANITGSPSLVIQAENLSELQRYCFRAAACNAPPGLAA